MNMNFYVLFWFNWRYCIAKKSPFFKHENIEKSYTYQLTGDENLVYPTRITKVNESINSNYFCSIISAKPFKTVEEGEFYWLESYKRDTDANEIFSVQNNNFVTIKHLIKPHYFSNQTEIPFMIKSTNFSSVKLIFKILEKYKITPFSSGYDKFKNALNGFFVTAIELSNMEEVLFKLNMCEVLSVDILLLKISVEHEKTLSNIHYLQREILRILTPNGKLIILEAISEDIDIENSFEFNSIRKLTEFIIYNNTKATILQNNPYNYS